MSAGDTPAQAALAAVVEENRLLHDRLHRSEERAAELAERLALAEAAIARRAPRVPPAGREPPWPPAPPVGAEERPLSASPPPGAACAPPSPALREPLLAAFAGLDGERLALVGAADPEVLAALLRRPGLVSLVLACSPDAPPLPAGPQDGRVAPAAWRPGARLRRLDAVDAALMMGLPALGAALPAVFLSRPRALLLPLAPGADAAVASWLRAAAEAEDYDLDLRPLDAGAAGLALLRAREP